MTDLLLRVTLIKYWFHKIFKTQKIKFKLFINIVLINSVVDSNLNKNYYQQRNGIVKKCAVISLSTH